MTDDLTPDTPDQRDERIAALLEVEALDEVTRRRLVAKAVAAVEAGDAPRARPRRRILATAAAVALVVTASAGVLVVATGDGGDDTTVAGRSAQTSADAEGREREAAPATPEAGAPAAEMAVPPRNLGELGDVSDRDQLRATLSQRVEVLENATRDVTRQLNSYAPCLAPDRFPTQPYAFATGTLDGEPVLVLVATPPPSSEVTVVDPRTCAARATLSL